MKVCGLLNRRRKFVADRIGGEPAGRHPGFEALRFTSAVAFSTVRHFLQYLYTCVVLLCGTLILSKYVSSSASESTTDSGEGDFRTRFRDVSNVRGISWIGKGRTRDGLEVHEGSTFNRESNWEFSNKKQDNCKVIRFESSIESVKPQKNK